MLCIFFKYLIILIKIFLLLSFDVDVSAVGRFPFGWFFTDAILVM